MEMVKLDLYKKIACITLAAILLMVSAAGMADCDDELESEPGMPAFSQTRAGDLGNGANEAAAAAVVASEVHDADNSAENIKPPVINALAAVVVEESTGRILYSRNAMDKRSIASTTKIMTALVALENANVEDEVTVSKRAVSIGGSVVGLREGQKYTLRELLYALLMISGNDAAIAIAEHVGGSVENFAVMMNERAKSLGAVNSRFVTPHGLDRENQYSTAYDVALITIEALKHPLFREIVSTSKSYIPGHSLYNTNELLGSCPGVDGVKTGYTGKAGRCLVTTAKRNGMRLISVVLGSPTRGARAEASRRLLDYCFGNYKMYRLMSEGDIFARIPVYRGISGYVALRAEKDIVLPLSKSEAESLSVSEHVPDMLKAPVYAGSVTGYVEYVLDGKVIAQNMLMVEKDIRKTTYLDYLGDILETWCKMIREGIFAGI